MPSVTCYIQVKEVTAIYSRSVSRWTPEALLAIQEVTAIIIANLNGQWKQVEMCNGKHESLFHDFSECRAPLCFRFVLKSAFPFYISY